MPLTTRQNLVIRGDVPEFKNCAPDSRSGVTVTEVVENGTTEFLGYGFLLVFSSNIGVQCTI